MVWILFMDFFIEFNVDVSLYGILFMIDLIFIFYIKESSMI